MDAAATASVIGAKLSGLAMWPTLVCDGSRGDTLIVSRGANGGRAQKSHWQTVLQLMSDEPLSVEPGDSVTFDFEARPEKATVTKVTTYAWGGVQRGRDATLARGWHVACRRGVARWPRHRARGVVPRLKVTYRG